MLSWKNFLRVSEVLKLDMVSAFEVVNLQEVFYNR